jgi:hypothetical protein
LDALRKRSAFVSAHLEIHQAHDQVRYQHNNEQIVFVGAWLDFLQGQPLLQNNLARATEAQGGCGWTMT